ncbi:BRCA1-A complex subunit Abraxas 1 [Nematolebias whitei]|uniref:BRCA1-A complex subunit Abraxas 1 n=1 Tax=Nematolebias whitei TaxID=451745 RepID=UPI0018994138|nr:BRCA1-A complex subunit Abraxas 1 [Nematolebias whitei]
MAESLLSLSGTVLASLMFQHVNSDTEVEGLLIGESRVVEKVITGNSQSDHIQREEFYNIQKHIACHSLSTLYTSSGEVNMAALQKMLADNEQDKVIGWYRQRKDTELHVTFRERLVHEKLKSALSKPNMIFMLLTSSSLTMTGATHMTEYSAFISRNRCLVSIPVLVTNLGLLEQQAYWKESVMCTAVGYNLIMKDSRSKFTSDGQLKEVNEVIKMNESLQGKLQKACRDVEESERAVEVLQAEVSALKKELQEKQRAAAGKDSKPTSPPEPKNNLLLLEAAKSLLGSSPVCLTQTPNLQAFPVSDERVPMETEVNSDTVQEQLPLL